MFDRRSYLDTISALRADPDKLEEIIKMKENDRRHIPHSLRPVAAVAAALALLGISVGAVNTEPVQEFLYHISTAVQVGVFRQDITTEEGVDLTIYHMPEVSLEDRDGRAILLLDGEETDITDALAQDGHYTFQQQSEGTVLDLTVTGSVQDWTLICSVHGEGEEGPVYTYTGGEADSSTVTVDTGDEVSGVVSAEPKEGGLTAASDPPAGCALNASRVSRVLSPAEPRVPRRGDAARGTRSFSQVTGSKSEAGRPQMGHRKSSGRVSDS